MTSRAQRLRRELVVFWIVLSLVSGFVLLAVVWPR
jgi:hypothetical protein